MNHAVQRRETRAVTDPDLIAIGQTVLKIESDAVSDLAKSLGAPFAAACRVLLASRGRVVVMGMGKSGHIGGKLASTLASTGTPAFFVHPGEASHGDLGMITPGDVIIAISNSGETDELLMLLPLIKRLGIALIALTGNESSTLAKEATVHLLVATPLEACPLGLAPTSSTTACLAMGDALAVALLEAKGFTREDFAFSHPGGSLGRRILVRVQDLMHTGERVPTVSVEASLRQAIVEMTAKQLGMTAVIDGHGQLLGIFTDGDLRRLLDRTTDLAAVNLSEVMTRNCVTAAPDALAAEALLRMEQHRINALPVVEPDGRLIGALNMHDLLRARIA